MLQAQITRNLILGEKINFTLKQFLSTFSLKIVNFGSVQIELLTADYCTETLNQAKATRCMLKM